MVESFSLQSDEVGDYTTVWIPRVAGEYTVRSVMKKMNNEENEGNDVEIVQKEKTVTIETISPHFASTLTAGILLQ